MQPQGGWEAPSAAKASTVALNHAAQGALQSRARILLHNLQGEFGAVKA